MNNKQIKNIKAEKRIEELGGHLYHYTSIRTLDGFLRNKELWLSSTSGMNDKTECRTLIEDIEQGLIDELTGEPLVKCKEYFSNLKGRLSDEYPFAMCFSKCEDNAAMWERYADNAQGVCIVFNTGELFKILSGDLLFTNVYYGYDAKNHEHYEILKEYFKNGKLLHNFNNINEVTDNLIACGYAYKHRSFDSENEVRITTLWKYIPTHSNIEYKNMGTQIKKVLVMKIDEMCKEAEIPFNNLIDEIVIAPRSDQSVADLKGYLCYLDLNELAGKVRKSDCPLR